MGGGALLLPELLEEGERRGGGPFPLTEVLGGGPFPLPEVLGGGPFPFVLSALVLGGGPLPLTGSIFGGGPATATLLFGGGIADAGVLTECSGSLEGLADMSTPTLVSTWDTQSPLPLWFRLYLRPGATRLVVLVSLLVWAL
jgi:hypothetical protein